MGSDQLSVHFWVNINIQLSSLVILPFCQPHKHSIKFSCYPSLLPITVQWPWQGSWRHEKHRYAKTKFSRIACALHSDKNVLCCSTASVWARPIVNITIYKGQGEPNRALGLELSCPLGTTRDIPQEKFPRKPYNKSCIHQACSVKMAGYWPSSIFFGEFMFVSVHKHSKKELGKYPAILTSLLVNNTYFCASRP